MRAGELDRRITLKEPVRTTDTAGGIVTTYTDVATVSAKKRDVSGREKFRAEQVNAELTTRFTIRYRSDIQNDWRIVFKSKDYDILVIRETERNAVLEIDAAARVD